MDRNFIIVVGNQGCGKSVWSKLYSQNLKRLLVADPMASYAGVDFVTPPDEWVRDLVEGKIKTFRFGTYRSDEIGILGNAAFAAGDCTFLVEECALIFRRGEELHDWANRLVFMGRHRSVDFILIAQRAAKIPVDIRSQANRIITFRQTEPADVNALIDRIGDYAEALPALEDLHCIDWDGGKVTTYSIRPSGADSAPPPTTDPNA